MMMSDAPKKPVDLDQAAWDAARKVANAYLSNQEIIARALVAYQAPLEASLRTIQQSMVKYLKQEMTAEEFALEVIGAVGNGKLNKALEGKK
jgi:hypothetical protein